MSVVTASGIDRAASARASREDRRVVFRGHRLGYGVLKAIAALGRAVRVPGVGVVVNDAALIRSVLLDADRFSKVGPGGSSELWTPVIGPNALLNMEGAEHAHLRRTLAPMFTPRFLADIVADTLTPVLDDVKARLIAGERVDIAEAAERSAALVICRLTGRPVDDPDDAIGRLAAAREMLAVVTLTTKRFSPDQLAFMHRKLEEINASTRAAYRANTAGTVPALLRSSGLSEDDALSVVAAMVIAGTETIVSFVPRFTQLIVTSGYVDHLAAHPQEATAAVNEGLRVTVPSPLMIRSVLTATRIGRARVRPGDRVVLSSIMACQKAGDFDPFRPVPKDMRQLWFGAGAHFCIGMPLAMLEATSFAVALAEAHAARPFRIVSKRRKGNTVAAGYESLVIQCLT